MIKFPSYTSAIITGAIGMPIFLFVLNYIRDKSGSQFSLIVWSIIGFFIPLLISTSDIGYIRKGHREGRPLFKPWAKAEDFKQFYIPAWKRMFAWFLATCISLLFFQLLGINFG